jgi:hypothetical protein
MMHGRSRDSRQADDARRYREATDTALDQLDWVINYLFSIQKGRIAAALKRNRDEMRKSLR